MSGYLDKYDLQTYKKMYDESFALFYKEGGINANEQRAHDFALKVMELESLKTDSELAVEAIDRLDFRH